MSSIFFRLPPELRLEVYGYCFDIEYDDHPSHSWENLGDLVDLHVLKRTWKHSPKGLQLFLVCRLIFKEASYLFYRKYFPSFRFVVTSLNGLKSRLLRIPEYYRHAANATFVKPEIIPFSSGSDPTSQQVLIWPPSGASWARFVESDGFTRLRLYCNDFVISKHLSPAWQLLLWRIDGKAGNIPWKESEDAQIDCDRLLVHDFHYKTKLNRATQLGFHLGYHDGISIPTRHSVGSSTRAPSPVDDDATDEPPPDSIISRISTSLAASKLGAVKEAVDTAATQDVPPGTKEDSGPEEADSEDETYLFDYEKVRAKAPGGVETISLHSPMNHEGPPSNSTARMKIPASDASEEHEPNQYQKMSQSDNSSEDCAMGEEVCAGQLELRVDKLLKEQASASDLNPDERGQQSSAIISVEGEELQNLLVEPTWSFPPRSSSIQPRPRICSPYPLPPPAITTDSPSTADTHAPSAPTPTRSPTPHISPDQRTLPSQTPSPPKKTPPALPAPPIRPAPSPPPDFLPGDTTPLKKPSQPAEERPWWDTPPGKRGGASRSPRKRAAVAAETGGQAGLSHAACMLATRGDEEEGGEFYYMRGGHGDGDGDGDGDEVDGRGGWLAG